MSEKTNALLAEFSSELETAATMDALEEIRVKYLGKKGLVNEILNSRRKERIRSGSKRS